MNRNIVSEPPYVLWLFTHLLIFLLLKKIDTKKLQKQGGSDTCL